MTVAELIKHVKALPLAEKKEFWKQLQAIKDDDFSDMLIASQSSTGFWDNSIDDEVWNSAS